MAWWHAGLSHLSGAGDDALGAQREGPGRWNSTQGTPSLGDLAQGNECMSWEWGKRYRYVKPTQEALIIPVDTEFSGKGQGSDDSRISLKASRMIRLLLCESQQRFSASSSRLGECMPVTKHQCEVTGLLAPALFDHNVGLSGGGILRDLKRDDEAVCLGLASWSLMGRAGIRAAALGSWCPVLSLLHAGLQKIPVQKGPLISLQISSLLMSILKKFWPIE